MLIDHLRRDFDRRNYNRVQYGNIHPEVIAWKKRIRNNSGSVSNKTLRAVDWFYRRLKSTSFFNKILLLNCVVPDNLTAALTPLIDPTRQYRWTNNGIFPSSLDIDGIRNTGGILGSSYIQTGFIPSNYFPADASNGGMTFYVSNAHNPLSTATSLFGALSSGGDKRMQAYLFGPGVAVATFNSVIYDDGITNSLVSDVGYYSFNRRSTSVHEAYRGFDNRFNWLSIPSLIHQNAGSSAVAPIYGVPEVECFFLASNLDGSKYRSLHETQAISFIASHFGLTFEESNTFYHLVEVFRLKIGGGFGKSEST